MLRVGQEMLEYAMLRDGLFLLGCAGATALAGCGTGTAASLTPTQTKPVEYVSLAPRTSNGSGAPIRIPDAPRSPASKGTTEKKPTSAGDSSTQKAGPNAGTRPKSDDRQTKEGRRERDNGR